MAISTDALIEFFAGQTDLDSTSAAVSDAAFSIATDTAVFTNSDDAMSGVIILLTNFSVAPDANSVINVYLRALNIVSTNDAEVPDANFPHSYICSIPLNDVTTAQYSNPIKFSFPNAKSGQEYEVYIENQAGQTLPAGWIPYITATAPGPHG